MQTPIAQTSTIWCAMLYFQIRLKFLSILFIWDVCIEYFYTTKTMYFCVKNFESYNHLYEWAFYVTIRPK